MGTRSETILAESVCLPFLRDSQNADGGWGFHPGSQSRSESTCWALLALSDSPRQELSEGVARGFQFLRAAQLPDGSWPSTPEQKTGCWVTSLACWVLLADGNSAKAAAAGLNWICRDWPRDSTLWRRLLGKLSSQRGVAPVNDSYRGWGWTPGTSSWVEPTSFALLALEHAPNDLVPPAAKRRRHLAEALLYDRMCPGGGWNSGNPRVYGVAGEPLVVPTVWALLALRSYPERTENASSLVWLERNITSIHSGGSLALAQLCLQAYGRPWSPGAQELHHLYQNNWFLQSLPVNAWTCLAARGRPGWLSPAGGKS
jgi:hypothetical protein